MYEEIIKRLLCYPQRGQIQIDFDVKKQKFRLSVPIFSSKGEIPKGIKEYALKRKNLTFKPYVTFYELKENRVLLIQEIPFSLDFQTTLRSEIDAFWKMSRECHKMLSEIGVEEIYQDALYLDSDS
jgi:hypothetical protein